MATLQTYIDLLPPHLKIRYGTGSYFWTWLNELLEKLQVAGLLREQKKEAGQIITNDKWLKKPADLIQLLHVFDPEDRLIEYRVEEVEGKFLLKDVNIADENSTSQVSATAFTHYATTYIDINKTGYDADDLENYLFMITAGTYANIGYVIHNNDVSGGEETRIYFEHELSAALDGTKVTAARLVPPDYYLMMQYLAKYTAIASNAAEVPINNDYEARLIPTWLRYKAEQQTSLISNETIYWEKKANEILWHIECENNNRVITPSRGRRLVGFESEVDTTLKAHPDYSEYA